MSADHVVYGLVDNGELRPDSVLVKQAEVQQMTGCSCRRKVWSANTTLIFGVPVSSSLHAASHQVSHDNISEYFIDLLLKVLFYIHLQKGISEAFEIYIQCISTINYTISILYLMNQTSC